MIRVQPAAAVRTEFARWAVAQRPKLAMASECAFGVPAVLFRDMPEELLIGALIDGKRYVPVAEAVPEAVPAAVPAAADGASGQEPSGEAGGQDAGAGAADDVSGGQSGGVPDVPAAGQEPAPAEPAAEPAGQATPAAAAKRPRRTKTKTTGNGGSR